MKRIITVNSNNMPKSLQTKKVLIKKLMQLGFDVSDSIEHNSELIISIGGDGSFLKTIHDYGLVDIPIIGINTGHLGFFAELLPNKIDEFINMYINKDFFIQTICLLEVKICTKELDVNTWAINEVVIKNIASRTVHLNLEVNENKIQRFSGDGVLIATPMGSPAYNYSAGGSIVDPSLNLLQLTPISPMNTNAYRSFTSSIILPENSMIKISPEYTFTNSILVVIDGEECKFNNIEVIKVIKSNTKVSLLRLRNYKFWNRVAEKFL